MKALPRPDIPPYAWEQMWMLNVLAIKRVLKPGYRRTSPHSSPHQSGSGNSLLSYCHSISSDKLFQARGPQWYLEDGEAGLEEVIKGSPRCFRSKFATKQLRLRIWRLKDREDKNWEPACQGGQRWRWRGQEGRAGQRWKQLSQQETSPNHPWLSSTCEGNKYFFWSFNKFYLLCNLEGSQETNTPHHRKSHRRNNLGVKRSKKGLREKYIQFCLAWKGGEL